MYNFIRVDFYVFADAGDKSISRTNQRKVFLQKISFAFNLFAF